MTSVQIRKKLHDYIEQADDRLLHMVFALMNEYAESGYDLDEKQYAMLEKRRKEYLSGEGKSYNLKEVRRMVAGKNK